MSKKAQGIDGVHPSRAGLIHGFVRLGGIHANVLRVIHEARSPRAKGSFIDRSDITLILADKYSPSSIRAALGRLKAAGMVFIVCEYRQPYGGMPAKAWSTSKKKYDRVTPKEKWSRQREYRERKRAKQGRTFWDEKRHCWIEPPNQPPRINSIFQLGQFHEQSNHDRF